MLSDFTPVCLKQLWRAVNGLLHPPSPAALAPMGWAQTIFYYIVAKVFLPRMAGLSSRLDVVPTWILMDLTDTLSPMIAHLANLSFETGIFPAKLKVAQITPILKKSGLNVDDPSNYRLISNLSSISKILKQLVLAKMLPHLSSSPNVDSRQFAYEHDKSKETSLLHVYYTTCTD